MKCKFLNNSFKKIIDGLSYFYDKWSSEEILRDEKEEHRFHSLSPTDEAENVEEYINAIDWALQNRKKIKNIAISGTYGSGKSSVIQTFQKINAKKEYIFLNISLATFKEENIEKITQDNNTTRCIELSILQQLFYHEKDEKVPDSRFKKIKNRKMLDSIWITVISIILLVAFLFLLAPEFLLKFSPFLKMPDWVDLTYLTKITHSLASFAVITGITYFVFKSIRVIDGLNIKKLKFKNAEIEVGEGVEKSVFNSHIDEILYFFEATNYNIVIIEDLDRFEQTEIFTKLREINLLINNSKKIKREVVFVYAIRDDKFKDEERTKFFDFMIPIIPVINSSNSKEKLSIIVKENEYEISSGLLDDLSLFIDDMRLLYNIMNEYHIYFKKLNNDLNNLNQDKLLSMVVYKNMHPKDFTELSNSSGVLFDTISKKHEYIKSEIEEIDKEISQIEIEIKRIEETNLSDIKELRVIYLSKVVEKINNTNQHSFKKFFVNNTICEFSNATEKDTFDYIVGSSSIQYLYQDNIHQRSSFTCSFEDIEKEINPDITFREREKLVLNKNKTEILKGKINKLEVQKDVVKKSKIKNLISKEQFLVETGSIKKNVKQNELIGVLLRGGYIEEDYLDYISIFYEGDLVKADKQFLIDVKTQKSNDFNYKLTRVKNLIERLDLIEFDNKYILNFDLLDALLSDDKQEVKRARIFLQFKNEENKLIDFIDGFIDYTVNEETFIRLLCENWKSIWSFVEKEPKFTKERRGKYFKLIIEHGRIENIRQIFDGFESRISKDSSFLEIIEDANKLKEIIKSLNIKFEVIDKSSSEDLLDFIYEGDYYALNPEVLKTMLEHKKVFKQTEFDEKNYSALKQTNLECLVNYITCNINEYITSVYLKLDKNKDEPEELLVELLNNEEILIENKEKLINQTKALIRNVSNIEDLEVIDVLLEKKKVSVSWENVISVYTKCEKQLTKELISFINVLENSECLSKKNIEIEKPDKKTVQDFIKAFLLEEGIENRSYAYLLNSVPYVYGSLAFSELSYEKVELLVEKEILIINNDNFSLLKEYTALQIKLIENDPYVFIKNINSFTLDNEDISMLLDSVKIPLIVKKDVVANFDTATFIDDVDLLSQVGKLLLESSAFDIDESIIKAIVSKSNLTTPDKIEIFNNKNELFDKEDVEEFILSWGEPYSNILKKGKCPLIENNNVNEKLVSILEQKRYISSFKIEKKGIRVRTFLK